MKERLTRRPDHRPIIKVLRSPLCEGRLASPFLVQIAKFPGPSILVNRTLLRIRRLIAQASAFGRYGKVRMEFGDKASLAATSVRRVVLRVVVVSAARVNFRVANTQVRQRRTNARRALVVTSQVRQERHHICDASPARRARLSQFIGNDLCLFLAHSHLLRNAMPVYLIRDVRGSHVGLTLAWVAKGQDVAFSSLLFGGYELGVASSVLASNVLDVFLRAKVGNHVCFWAVHVRVVRFSVDLFILIAPAMYEVHFPNGQIFLRLLRLPSPVIFALEFLHHRGWTRVFTRVEDRPFLVVRAAGVGYRQRDLRQIAFHLHCVTNFLRLFRGHIAPSTYPLIVTPKVGVEKVLARSSGYHHFLSLRHLKHLSRVGANDELSSRNVVGGIGLVRMRVGSLFLHVVAFGLSNGRPLSQFLRRAFRRVIGA